MTSTPEARLLEAHDLARSALHEVTPDETVGEPAGHLDEGDGAVSLLFENRMPGYPGWFWTVSIARVEGEAPTVLEVELMPGEGALLAPEWVPWAVRLADYQAVQAAAGATDESAGDDELTDDQDLDDEDLDDEDLDDADEEDDDSADFHEDGSPVLHAGDLDGVDIDELDPSVQDAAEQDDDAPDDEDDAELDDNAAR